MCGIVGFFNEGNASGNAANALEIIKDRGRDGFGISDGKNTDYSKAIDSLKKLESESVIGHCLHSVVNDISQPLVSESKRFILSSNCEIYNWKELCRKHKIKARNDSELMLKLAEKGLDVAEIVDELDGVYAFALWDAKLGKVHVARDIIGEKPVFYSLKHGSANVFAFASERKALDRLGYSEIEELNPRTVLAYDINRKKLSKSRREFFRITPELKKSFEQLKNEAKELIIQSVGKRVPERKFGVLFSGGIDSMLIAFLLKKLGCDFTCYTAAFKEEGTSEAEDVVYAKKAAKKYGLKLKIAYLDLNQTEQAIKEIIPLIETSHVVKVDVALPFYAACMQAKKDGIKVIFSGLGAEEIFSGYERHKRSTYLNKECLSGLLKVYEKDLYRDDLITMHNNIELRIPFLDTKLCEYALRIPVKYKMNELGTKVILRQIANDLGIDKEFSFRKKKAAQYGSRFDKALQRLSKRAGFKLKSAYVNQFAEKPNLKLGVLFSSGKDSAYAAYFMKRLNYELSCLINIKSKNPDSFMYHTPNVELVKLQSEAMDIPLVQFETKGVKEDELNDLKKALIKAKEQYKIQGVVTGALYSNYQRERIEKVCDSIGLKIFSPLWHMDQERLMKLLLNEKFEIVLSSVAAEGFNKEWLGKTLTKEHVDRLVKLNQKYGINIAGEGGEFESLVLDCPLFKKKIIILDSEIAVEAENTAKFIVKKAKLVSK